MKKLLTIPLIAMTWSLSFIWNAYWQENKNTVYTKEVLEICKENTCLESNKNEAYMRVEWDHTYLYIFKYVYNFNTEKVKRNDILREFWKDNFVVKSEKTNLLCWNRNDWETCNLSLFLVDWKQDLNAKWEDKIKYKNSKWSEYIKIKLWDKNLFENVPKESFDLLASILFKEYLYMEEINEDKFINSLKFLKEKSQELRDNSNTIDRFIERAYRFSYQAFFYDYNYPKEAVNNWPLTETQIKNIKWRKSFSWFEWLYWWLNYWKQTCWGYSNMFWLMLLFQWVEDVSRVEWPTDSLSNNWTREYHAMIWIKNKYFDPTRDSYYFHRHWNLNLKFYWFYNHWINKMMDIHEIIK